MEQSEDNTNDNEQYEKYLDFYFPCPSNQYDCLMAIVGEAWDDGQALGEYDSDYIQDLIDLHSGKDPDYPIDIINDKLTVYGEVVRSIGEDLVQFRNGIYHFLEAFYQQKENVIKLIENDDVLNNVIKVISILETFKKKFKETLLDYEAHLCYSSFEDNLEELEKYCGKNAIKHFKKSDELTTKEYEFAFEEISAFVNFINKNEFGGRLMELGARIRVFCQLHLDDPKTEEVAKDRDHRPVTLIKFMQKYCERQKLQLLKYRRKSLNDANFRESITLPESIKEWRTGQAKYYKVSDLKEKWPDFCEVLPNLPPLKQ